RIPPGVERARLQCRQHERIGEFVARIDHVRTRGAERQRAIADVGERAALTEVQGHRHDLGAVRLGEAPDRGGTLQGAGVREYDAINARLTSASCWQVPGSPKLKVKSQT